MKIHTIINFKTLLSISVFAIVLLNQTNTVNAGIDDICDPPKGIFTRVQQAWEALDIRKTVVNMATSAAMDVPASFLANGDAADIYSCTAYIKGLVDSDDMNTDILPDIDSCSQYDEDYCKGLVNSYQTPDSRTGYLNTLQNSRASGSLVSLANVLDRGSKEPVPMNLAYFWNRQVEPIPFMGKALAQAPEDYSGPFLSVFYEFWKGFRNASFGAMSIIMIVIGIMIMTRKKLDPRTSVTVQYAVPRVLLALVLITFSYPIGAVIISLGWSLANSADNIIRALINVPDIDIGIFGYILLIGGYILKTIETAGFSIVLLLLTSIIVLILWIIAMIKFLTIYIKMLISVVIAPIIFTVGALPGKEEVTINWFKKILVHALSLFSIYLVIGLTQEATLAVFAGITNYSAIVSAIIGDYLLFLVLIYGYNYARKVPNKIEEAILGKKR